MLRSSIKTTLAQRSGLLYLVHEISSRTDEDENVITINFRQGLRRNHYTTNDIENGNSIIKKKVDYKAEISVICDEIKQLITRQKENIELAFVLDTGPYRVLPKFKYLSETPAAWMKLGEIAREKLRRILSSPFKPYTCGDHREISADDMGHSCM